MLYNSNQPECVGRSASNGGGGGEAAAVDSAQSNSKQHQQQQEREDYPAKRRQVSSDSGQGFSDSDSEQQQPESRSVRPRSFQAAAAAAGHADPIRQHDELTTPVAETAPSNGRKERAPNCATNGHKQQCMGPPALVALGLSSVNISPGGNRKTAIPQLSHSRLKRSWPEQARGGCCSAATSVIGPQQQLKEQQQQQQQQETQQQAAASQHGDGGSGGEPPEPDPGESGEDDETDEPLDYKPILARILNEKKMALISTPEVVAFLNTRQATSQQKMMRT